MCILFCPRAILLICIVYILQTGKLGVRDVCHRGFQLGGGQPGLCPLGRWFRGAGVTRSCLVYDPSWDQGTVWVPETRWGSPACSWACRPHLASSGTWCQFTTSTLRGVRPAWKQPHSQLHKLGPLTCPLWCPILSVSLWWKLPLGFWGGLNEINN